MGYYTSLDLKADFNITYNNIIFVREFTDWYNSLSYDEYMEKYHINEDWNKFIEENNFFTELKEFLLDNRGKMVLSNFEFQSIDEFLSLSIECEIKNYTGTYEKLYNLLLVCNPVDICIKERGEEMKSPDIYKLNNKELIKIQSGEYDV